jgi:hypothetical protein
MKRNSLLKAGLLAAAVITSAMSLTSNAQGLPSPQALVPVAVSLTSFEPNALFLNPTFPLSITLRHTASGSPTHYRFSRFADFRDAAWLPYASAPVAQIPASWFSVLTPPQGSFDRRMDLYFQLRAANPRAGRPIGFTPSAPTGPREIPAVRDGTSNTFLPGQPVGEMVLRTEPQFVNSNIKSKTILAGFAG